MAEYSNTTIAGISLYVASFGVIFGGIENVGIINILGRKRNTDKQKYGLHNAKSLLVIGDTAVRLRIKTTVHNLHSVPTDIIL